MSRDPGRRPPAGYRDRDPRVRGREREYDRQYYNRGYDKEMSHKRNHSPRMEKHRSRSPRKADKNDLDEKILSEISKLPEPSELWDSQFQDNNFAPPPPTFIEGSSNSYGANYQPHTQYSGIYDDFPPMSSVPPTPHPPEISGGWNTMSLPSAPAPPSFSNSAEDQKEERMKKEAAIESEMRHQKAALSKQREDYMKKAGILKKELETLKDQRNELRGDSKRSPSPDTKRFLKENTKLQLEIQNKLKTINNVVDMLNGIIGEEAQDIPVADDASERSSSKRKSRSPNMSSKYNYVYYDPEMHWCRVCNEFPSTAKDYLNHLHSPTHHKMAAAHLEAPWHSMTGVNEGFPSYPSAPTKRTPIKGLQFFVPSTAWYCKLCDQFIGDLHCASAHLKSITHSKNYTNFVEQNPHWETDWMSDRQKAFEKSRGKNAKQENKPSYTAHTITFNKDGFHSKRNKDSPPPVEEKKKKKEKKRKKKKESSSSSSDSWDSTDSEKVSKKKKSKKDKIKSQAHDKALNQWMSAIAVDKLNESDRKLIDNIKQRIKLEKRDDRRNNRSPDRQERGKEREKERSLTDSRKERRGSRSREERREEQRGNASPKKPDIKKMPFIGKMPVFKNLKKPEEIKKEDQKKDEETVKKKKEEMDAEIQRKVAEFKEKISRAQQERAISTLGAPGMALPTQLGASVPFLAPPQIQAPPISAPAQPPQAPNLPKDFQEALDIIFPSEAQKAIDKVNQELFNSIPGFVPPLIPGFPNIPMIQPQIPPQMMMGFDINSQMFQNQLYDNHIQNTHQPSQNQQNQRQSQPQNKKNNQQNQFRNQQKNQNGSQKLQKNNKEMEAKNQEEMDDLAMLGIDATDVGAMN